MSQLDRNGIEDTDDGSNRLAWFLTGAVIGATVAMLYAPKSGKDTRQVISDKTQKGKEAISGAGKDVADASREMFDRGRKLVEDAAELFERGRKLVKG
jgi:gas vesicle protein